MCRLLRFSQIFLLLFFVVQLHAANSQPLKQKLSDAKITQSIVAKYRTNKNLSSLNIVVSTNHGVVKLTGYVEDKQAFVDALRYAIATDGVRSVDADSLDIKRVNSALKDAYITAKVEAAILKAKVFDDESIPLVGINATTSDGIVTLTGQVKYTKSIEAILQRANEVHGVKKIISHLKLGAVATSLS